MLLPPEKLDEFMRAYEEAFDEKITSEAATEMFLRLLSLYRRIAAVGQTPDTGFEEHAAIDQL